MPLSITTRQNYRLKVEICNETAIPSLFCVLRPLSSRAAEFDVGAGLAGSYPSIVPAATELLLSKLAGPFLTARDASLGTVNLSKSLRVGAGAPLCQQAIGGGTVLLSSYELVYASAAASGGKSVITAEFSQGVSFSQAQSGVGLGIGIPLDCVFGNSPSLYEVVIFSGSSSTPRIWFSDFLSVQPQGTAAEDPSRKTPNCGVSFSVAGSTESLTSTGMLGVGGGT